MMRRTFIAAMAAMLLFPPCAALAGDYSKDGLVIGQPWARPTAEDAKLGAAYFTIRNDGPADDRLVGVKTPISESAEMHAVIYDGGVVRMRLMPVGVPAPAGATVKFEPGDLHVMLVGLKGGLVEGQRFPLTLIFEKAGEVQVEVSVEKRPEAKSEGGGHGHHGHHGHH